ncbi:MAG: T9SS type A sorting domain-containing protein [Chitinophagales bacterium]|nr:T9SS type A sorting domain-containing protein [Chitinophagales bacterium]
MTQLFQFDTWAPDFVSSMILVDTIPFEQPTLQDWFSEPMLAPDSKIYISTYNSIKALHVINNPDSLGTSCDFLRKGLILPMYNGCAIPNLVNYDLAQSDGIDTCESIYTTSLSQIIDQSIYRIYPNPVSDFLNIIYQSNEDALLELFDLYGKRVGAISLFHYFKNRLLNVSNLPSGVYLATVSCKGERVWSEKVVVQR